MAKTLSSTGGKLAPITVTYHNMTILMMLMTSFIYGASALPRFIHSPMFLGWRVSNTVNIVLYRMTIILLLEEQMLLLCRNS